nr:hypothetical protein OHB51_19370 [Micromonospora sp. NBC_00855]
MLKETVPLLSQENDGVKLALPNPRSSSNAPIGAEGYGGHGWE